MAAPKGHEFARKYSDEQISIIEDSLQTYIESNKIPSISGYIIYLAEEHQIFIPRSTLCSMGRIKHILMEITKRNGRHNNKKKYGYQKYISGAQVAKYKYKNDIGFKLRICFSSRLRAALKSFGIKKNKKTEDILKQNLGYTLSDLKEHIESLFANGMSWDNYGKWHIDHILPVASFKCKSMADSEFKKCWSLGNLRPMWAKDNIKKGAFLENV